MLQLESLLYVATLQILREHLFFCTLLAEWDALILQSLCKQLAT